MGRPSKNAVFSHYFLPGFLDPEKFDHNARFNRNQLKYQGPESGQRKLADSDGLSLTGNIRIIP